MNSPLQIKSYNGKLDVSLESSLVCPPPGKYEWNYGISTKEGELQTLFFEQNYGISGQNGNYKLCSSNNTRKIYM